MKLHIKKESLISCIAILLSFCFSFPAKAAGRYTDVSVLSKGNWIKIQIEKDGIYKLAYADLKKMGFDDPSKVAVYGYGGWPLEEDFSKPYIDDLPPVPVIKKDDYILFYGRGTTKWEYSDQTFVHTNNPYSLYGYYFLTDEAEAKVADIIPATHKEAGLRIETFDDCLLHEKDIASLNQSGRKLYEKLSKTSQVFNDFGDPEGLGIEEGTVFVDCSFVAHTNDKNNKVTLSVDNGNALTGRVGLAGDKSYIKGRELKLAGDLPYKKGDKLSLKLNYINAGTLSLNGYVDYIRMHVKRRLKVYDEPFTFFCSVASLSVASRFVIEGANAACIVMDITDPLNPKVVETELNGSSLSFIIPANNLLRKFVLIRTDRSDFPVPVNEGKIECRNLHGLSALDMVIISPSGLKSEAERLKEAHEERDGLRVGVFTPEEIYNEFSSGTPDATAYRRFMKMLFDKATSDADKPRYLLLFGDGAYDNRFISSDWQRFPSNLRKNMLLTYQTEESLNDRSYVVDDYFGFLQDNQGSSLNRAAVNLGIGRFPIRTLTEARNMVDKVISYMDNKVGDWKTKLCFIADDGNTIDKFDTSHQIHADQLAETWEKKRPEYISQKIFFDAFKKDKSGKESYPDVVSLIEKTLKEGCFMINYTGHGSAASLSDENVITQNQIIQATYRYLPVWVTASCNFCPFDAPATSIGEDVFLNKTSGGIALFTTNRVAFRDDNKDINKALLESLFNSNTHPVTLGDAMKTVKNGIANVRKLGFCLIGDPALKLSYPKDQVQLEVINGKDIAGENFEFKSQEKVELEGAVYSADGGLLSDFNGIVKIRVFDARDTIETLGNNKYRHVEGKESWDSVPRIKYVDYTNTIILTSDSVKNGKFKTSFIIPKDISYKTGKKGKMSLYAYENESKRDAAGSFKDFSVAGTSDQPRIDNTPPEIRSVFLNDTTFTDGGEVNITPYFYAKVWDESGINITESGIGHGITLSIDNDPNTRYLLNNYYENNPGSNGEGTVKFSIPALSPGLHSAEFKIWDIMNNSTTYTFSFHVVEGLKPFITRIVATPTPARGNVEFHITHNRPESRMKVGILVYDIAGRLHWKHEETGSSELFKDYRIEWDLRNNAGAHVPPGVYIYRAAISTNNSKEATEAKKMIILW